MYIKSPTRVDLSGGTLDCWPLHHLIDEPCYTINLSINIFTEVNLNKRDDKKVIIEVKNFCYKREFSHLDECLKSPDQELLFLKPHLTYWQPGFGFEVRTSSQSPVGAGLGGSSSLCISLIKAFSRLCRDKEMSLPEMVILGSNMEARMLKTLTGTQDYYPAVRPGLNLIEYGMGGTRWESLGFNEKLFKNRMTLVYTGRPHNSGINNWQVIKAAVEGDVRTLNSLSRIAQISFEMLSVCRERQWNQLPRLFREEYLARTQLNPSFTSPEIKRLQELALRSGAEAVKICGAGGGGCVMVWSPPELRSKVIEECQKNQFQVIEALPFL